MPYLFNTDEDRAEMLTAIGAESVDELFSAIPAELRFKGDLDVGPALTELELTQHLNELSAKNLHAGNAACFLGAGSYDHFIPAVVDSLASRGEFYTSYTPYQPEVSQGNLQAMFEYQTLVCQLTGMDVSNASLYDGGSAVVEAVLLCLAAHKKGSKVVIAGSVHPEYRQIVETYLVNLDVELTIVPTPAGVIDADELARAVDGETACVVIQSPNVFGCIEDVEKLAKVAHGAGALVVQSFDPISLGILKRPGDMGVDVAVAEGQSLGNPMQFGGPYLGVMACREEFVRRMPGRIAGQTTSQGDRRCWVLTLQTREQHIRREKATSNICTNQGLFALRATIYLSLMGPVGMREAAELSLQKAHYAANQITAADRYALRFDQPFFKEFVVRDSTGAVADQLAKAEEDGYLAGVPLGQWSEEFNDCFLVAVTEKRTKAEIEGLAQSLVN